MIKIFSWDCESSGVHPIKNGIHQLAARIWIDWHLVDEFKVDVQLGPQHEWSEEALAVSGKTYDQVMASPITQEKLYKGIRGRLAKHVNPHDKTDKFFSLGFNNHAFDNQFMRSLFESMGDKYYGSWFWANSLDMMLSASDHLMAKRHLMPNFKLGTVAEFMGMTIDKEKLHDAFYDLTCHEFIFQKLHSIELTYGPPVEVPAQG